MLQVKIPKKNGVTPGTQFALRPAIGPTYDVFYLYLKNGLELQHLKNIQVVVRGKPIQTFRDGVQLQMLNKHYARPLADRDDVLAIWFYRPEFRLEHERANFALGTADVDTLSIEMDIADDAPEASDLVIKARQSGARPLGVITKIKQFPQTFAQGGEQDIADIPHRNAAIVGMHLGTPHIKAMRLELDSFKVVEGTKAELHDAYSQNVSAQANHAHISYFSAGAMTDALVTEGVNDFRVTVDLAQAATFPLMVEYFDQYAGI